MTNLAQKLYEKASIADVLIRYATVLDRRDWPALDQVFLEDAVTVYHGLGQYEGLEAITEVIRTFLEACGPTQHIMTNIRVDLDGDEADAKCYLQATHAGSGDFVGKKMTMWGEYSDRLVAGPDGWRIRRRELHTWYAEGDVGVGIKGEY